MKQQVIVTKQTKIERAFASKFAMHMFIVTLILFGMSYFGSRQFTHIDLNLYGYIH